MPPGQEHYAEPPRGYAPPPPSPPREKRPPPPPQRVARPPPPPQRVARPPPPTQRVARPPDGYHHRPPPPYAVPPTGGRGHFVGGLVLAMLLLIAVIVGLYSTSWYSNSEQSLGYSVSLDYGLSEMEGSIGFTTVEFKYEEYESQSVLSSPIIDTAGRTKGILFFGLIFLVIFMLLALAGAMDKAGDSLRRATPYIGYFAGLILLIAVIYFAVAFPNAIEEEGGTESTGSLGAAWYAVFLGSLLLLVGAEITRRAPSEYDDYEPRPYYY